MTGGEATLPTMTARENSPILPLDFRGFGHWELAGYTLESSLAF